MISRRSVHGWLHVRGPFDNTSGVEMAFMYSILFCFVFFSFFFSFFIWQSRVHCTSVQVYIVQCGFSDHYVLALNALTLILNCSSERQHDRQWQRWMQSESVAISCPIWSENEWSNQTKFRNIDWVWTNWISM